MLGIANSGVIYPHDARVIPNNKNNPTEFTFIFELDTALSDSDYMRMVFPFQVNSMTTGLWDDYVDCDTSSPSKFVDIEASAITDDDNAYFLQFYADANGNTLAALDSGEVYFMTFTIVPDSSATTGINFPIALSTTSNNVGNWITYDDNKVFATISLANSYVNSMTVTITASATDKLIFNAQHNVTIDVTPTISIENKARFDLILTNTEFSIISCDEPAGVISGVATLSSVSFDVESSSKVRVTINEDITADETYRFYCVVQNPGVANSGGFQVLSYKGYAETILEAGITTSGLSATTSSSSSSATFWDATYGKVKLGWGFDATQPSIPSVFRIYKDRDGNQQWYQNVRIEFRPATAVDASDTPLQMIFTTLEDDALTILETTLLHNMPDFSNSETVSCEITRGLITCSNVGSLEDDETYFMSFKFNLASSAIVTSAKDFGKMRAITQETVPVEAVSQSLTTLTYKDIKTAANLFHSGGANGIIARARTNPGAVDRTYVTNGEDIDLRFTFNYFSRDWIPIAGTTPVTIDRGVEFYTTHQLPGQGAPTCSIDTLTAGVDYSQSDCTITNVAGSYTRLRFRIGDVLDNTGAGPMDTLFATTGNNNDGTISFGVVNFPTHSSLLAVTEDIYDFYGQWVEGFTAGATTVSLATGSRAMFFNSLVVSDTGLADVGAGTVFFTTGATAADGENDGTIFPTLLRVSGFLSAAEQAVAENLVLFFNDMEPIVPEAPCYGAVGTECRYVDAFLENSEIDDLNDYSGSRMIQITLPSLSDPFNIYIPVKTIAGETDYGFMLAVGTEVDEDATAKNVFSTQFAKRVAARTTTNTFVGGALPVDPYTTPGIPNLNIPGGTVMGDLVAGTTINNVDTPYIVAAHNSIADEQGAAYGYCGSYEFYADGSFSLQTFFNTGQLNEACREIAYLDRFCYICPVHATMGAGPIALTVNNIEMPIDGGADFIDLVLLFGENTGDLAAASEDWQATALTSLTLNTHSIEFEPEDFKEGSKNMRTKLIFEPTTTLPQQIQIEITAADLYFTPVPEFGCYVNSLATGVVQSCATSGDNLNFFIDITTDEDWPAAEHEILFMVDSTDPALGADQTVNYQFTITVDGLTPLSALHDTSTVETYEVKDLPQEYFVLDNLSFFFGNKAATSIISFLFTIPSDVIITRGQQIFFDMGGIAPANEEETPQCYIKEADNETISTDFYTCDVTDLSQMLVEPKTTVSGSYILVLELVKIPSSIVPDGISVECIGFDGVFSIAENLGSRDLQMYPAPDKKLFSNTQITYERLFSDPGSVSIIKIGIRPSVNIIDVNSNMYVYFPEYYAAGLGYRNLYCQVNSELPIQCDLISNRLVKIRSFPIEVEIGDLVTVSIYGVVTPSVPTEPRNVFIGLDNDEDMFTLTEQGDVVDIESIAFAPNLLSPSGFEVDDSEIRETGEYTITFTTDSIGYKVGRVFSIDFPDRFGPFLGGLDTPTIKVSKVGSATTVSYTPYKIGNMLQFTLTSALAAVTQYQIVVQSFDGPEFEECSLDNPMVTISNSSMYGALYRTTINSWDIDRLTFSEDPELRELRYLDDDEDAVTSLDLSIGIFSAPVRIYPPNGENFANDVSFTVSNSEISVLPENLTAYRDDPYLEFRVASTNNTYPLNIYLDLVKDEGNSNPAYMHIVKLPVSLTNNKKTFPTPAIRIMLGGTSLPYSWDLAELDLIPESQLKIDITITDQDVSPLTFVGGSSVTFTPNIQSGSVSFELSESADPLDPPTFSIAKSSQDAANYELQSTLITVTILPIPSEAPAFNKILENQYTPTTHEFTMDVTQMASVYYRIAYNMDYQAESDIDCDTLMLLAQESTEYDPYNAFQEQYGVFYVYDEETDTQQIAENLLTNTQYEFMFCPVNQRGEQGTETNGTFTTMDNGATIQKVTVFFTRSESITSLREILCLFRDEFSLPDGNVVGAEGTRCEEDTYLDSTTSFDFQDYVFYIHGNRRSDRTSTLKDEIDVAIAAIGVETASEIKGKFIEAMRDGEINDDFQSIAVEEIQRFAVPEFSLDDVTITAESNSITISGLELNIGNGIFYLAANMGEDDPTYLNIRDKKNSSTFSIPGLNRRYSGTPLTITINSGDEEIRADTEYFVYIFASNMDFSDYGRTTEIQYLSITTPAEVVVESASMVKIAFMMMLVILGLAVAF